MKNIIKLSVIALAALSLASCDGFLSKDTISTLNSDTFFENEKSLELYANGFMQSMMPEASDIAESSDSYTDVCAARTGTAYLIQTWTSSNQTGWSYSNWTNLYRINYFLVHMREAKGVSEETFLKYEGIARFWRAFFYFAKMRTFGDVPWIEKPVDQNDEATLYGPRDSREVIAKKIVEDLDFAINNLPANVNTQQADKWKALAYKVRFCLYEGTYRKYHEINLSTGKAWTKDESAYYLGECISAAETIINEGPFKLNTAVSNTFYRSLFTTEAVNRTEVIWEREYCKDLNFTHSVNWDYWNYNSVCRSMTRRMADMYLCLDGSRYTSKSTYGKDLFPKETENRDLRMQQTIITPSYKKTINGTEVLYPFDATGTITGYQIIKYCYDDDQHTTSNNATCIPIIRYAEVLLSYAEASAELNSGVLSDEIWDKTIRPLRERAGVVGDKPVLIDSKLNNYYGGGLTNDLVEIRRERAVELFMEDTRWNDLMRWHQGDKLLGEIEGIYIPGKDVLMDVNGDGKMDTCFGDGAEDGVKYWSPLTYELTEDSHLHFTLARHWEEKMYLRPIPLTAVSINPNLGQNTGW